MALRVTRSELERLCPGHPALGEPKPARDRAEPLYAAKPGPPGRFEVLVPDWHPATVNQLMRSVRDRVRLKRRDRHAVIDHLVLRANVPRAAGRRVVGLTLCFPPGARRPDPDSSHKSILDALVYCGLLVDDGPVWCGVEPVRYLRGDSRYAVVTLEDVCPG